MKKQTKGSLKAALELAKEGTDTSAYSRSAVESAHAKSAPVEAPRAKGKKHNLAEVRFGVYMPHPAVMKALYDLAHEESGARRKKINDYFIEGIDAVFKKRGKPSIAELIKKAEG